jgi:selenide,water dikinase
LAQVLRHLPRAEDPRILVDQASRDDAAVYRLDAERALVATVDFFTPVVDDAATWGRIAAANALSDLYAMGATPRFGLSLVGWPRAAVPMELLGEALAGLGEVAQRAGCPIVGGHSVDALEPHLGMVAIGEAHPDRLLTNRGARPGDRLILTKPLGTGILTTALKRGLIGEEQLAEAVQVMTTLNFGAMRAGLANRVRAATDVTGYGLLGHLRNLVQASGVGATILADRVPLLAGAREHAARGAIPGGTERNLADLVEVSWSADINPVDRLLLVDAQTSGGLLLAVPREHEAALLGALALESTPARASIGEITAESGRIRVERSA